MESRDLTRLKGGIAGLKFLIDELRTASNDRIDEVKVDMRALQGRYNDLAARLAVAEARHQDIREDITARYPAQSADAAAEKLAKAGKAEKKPSEALETIKAIGPWILGGLSLLGTVVNALLQALANGSLGGH